MIKILNYTKHLQILLFIFLCIGQSRAQKIIYLDNPSFEDSPKAGVTVDRWTDCGPRGETPTDVQPYGGFSVTRPAFSGTTYVGMVTRANNTWESVGQELSHTLKNGSAYNFSLHLCKSGTYVSPTAENRNTLFNFTRGVVIRIWGGDNVCDRKELLDVTEVVDHTDWKKYKFKLEPKKGPHKAIIIEAFYKTPSLRAYNGNILVDNASPIELIEEELIVQNMPKEENTNDSKTDTTPVNEKPKDPVKEEPETTPTKTTVVIKENTTLDIPKELKVGDVLRLDNLYFVADSSNITAKSKVVLEDMYDFLQDNKMVNIEIGGHTNGLLKHSIGDSLSTERAKRVAAYFIDKGINPSRITYKGYGKRKPIASNKTVAGRKKNQRVEIKITGFK